jgi:1-acyl-sn-glycerol-3-phosphate acyltransferase
MVCSMGQLTDMAAADRSAVLTPARLASVIQSLLRELRGPQVPIPALDDDLERSLGIDSLARVELMLRLEQVFGVHLPESAMQAAQTPRDLLRALTAAAPPGGDAQACAPAVLPLSTSDTVELPRRAQTLPDVLHWHAEQAGARRHVLLLHGDSPQALDHAGLLARARSTAAALQQSGLAPGETVALMLPTGLPFLESFMGVLLAGAVPVPLYPPWRVSQLEEHLRRQARILTSAQVALLIADEQVLPAARILRAGAKHLRQVLTVDRLHAMAGQWRPVARTAQDTALIQYTSGSTDQPKGVVLTHANLLANIRAMGQALRAGPQDVIVSWLPMYHDMGLIGAWLGSLYHGAQLVLMSPQAFLNRPSRWLRAISDHRGTVTAGPNVAYEILATRVPDDALKGLDLRCLRAALNGAEPVHAATLSLFCERFARFGFDRRALMPVYGLAECGVGLAFPPLGRGPRVDSINRPALHARRHAEPADPAQAGVMHVVCCGAALPGYELRVVDGRGQELPNRQEGRIEFRGPSATPGYLRNPQATRALFDGQWLNSGDVGYVADGELYLTSRVKDLIIRGGHNIHPYDLEAAVGALPGVRRNCVAVFGANDPQTRTERIVVLVETRETEPTRRAALHERIAQLSLDVLGLPADAIVLAPPHAVLKTSSGKIRRSACRCLYEAGQLGQPARSVAGQMVRLWFDALQWRLREPLRHITAAVFAAWLWALFGVAAMAGAGAALLPARSARKQWARSITRASLRVSGLPLRVEGQSLLQGGPWIIVANHESYLDWWLLTALLPAQACLVAKRELGDSRLLGWILQRMGVRLVERQDLHASVEDAKRLVQAAREGESLVYFPEGTLTRAPGVQRFHMGAFIAAAQSGLNVVPVSLEGTRSVLRDGSWWPRRSPVVVRFHAPLGAEGNSWSDAVRLRDRARECIAQGCGEPLLLP